MLDKKFRTRNTPSDPSKGVHTPGPDMTKQSFANDADINALVNRHLKNSPGQSLANIGNPLASRKPMFGTMPSATFHEMLNAVMDVQTAFASLPARLRNRFGNNPEQLLRWVENPSNYKEAVKLGLIEDRDLLEEMADAEAAHAAEELRKQQEAAGQQNMLKPDKEAQPPYPGAKPPNPA